MIQRALAVVLAIGFVHLIERASARHMSERRSHCLVTTTLLAMVLALGVAPQSAYASAASAAQPAECLEEGSE